VAYPEKRGKSWRVRYKDPSGKYVTQSGFRTKSAALEYGRAQEAKVSEGTYVDPRKGRMPFGEWAAVWMAAQTIDPNTRAKRRRLLKLLLLEWEFTPIAEINLFAAKTWGARQTCDQTTVRHALTLLSMILTGASDADLIHGNPLAGRRRTTKSDNRKAAPKPEAVWAHPEDAHAIYERLGGVAGLMVLTCAYTGLRWGELAGLHRANCCLLRRDRLPDGSAFVRRVIRIDPQVGTLHEVEFELDEEELEAWRQAEEARIAKAVAAGKSPRRRKEPDARVQLYLGPPKNEKSAREVDVPPFLAELLASHMAVWPHEHLFSTPGGQYWRRGNFGRQQLRPAADGRKPLPASKGHAPRAAWDPILPGLTMRGLRHSHDTWMKEDRIDRALRFQRMGWVVRDIEGVYEHVTPDMRRELLEALEARWSRGRGAQVAS
jgi:integrase